MALSVLKMMRPYKVKGLNKVRVGRMFDGGYVMLDSFDSISAAYSLGINDDVSWDLAMARRGIPVFQYDHTIEGLPEPHPLFHWHKIGICGHPDEAPGMNTIERLIKQNGHENEQNLVLKCDIEGAEWLALRLTPACVLKQFKQIVVELHGFDMLTVPAHSDNIRTTMFNLLAFHRVVHVHGNNHAGFEVVGGFPIPSVIEVTFARLDCGEFSVSDEIFPTEIDMPCYMSRADLFLGRFEFS